MCMCAFVCAELCCVYVCVCVCVRACARVRMRACAHVRWGLDWCATALTRKPVQPHRIITQLQSQHTSKKQRTQRVRVYCLCALLALCS